MKKSYISFVALILVATLTTSCLRARLATRRTNQEQPAAVETKQDNTVSKVQKTQSAGRFDIPAPLLDRAEKILVRKAYTVSYNEDRRIPNWVAWELTRDHTTGKVKRPETKPCVP